MNDSDIKLFALNTSREYGARIGAHIGIPLAGHEERDFEDGEHKARPLESVRDRDVFVVQSLYSDPQQSVNDKLCRLLFFIGALRDASAARITAVTPYLCYARKDRKTQPRDPTTSRYVATQLEAAGADHVVTLDVHNLAAFHNAFRCTTDHLEAKSLFVDYFAPLAGDQQVAVVSPDVGGIKRAEAFRRALSERSGHEATAAFMEKQRSKGVVSGETLVGDIAGKTAVIIDDLISSGTTVARAARACRSSGATRVYAAASHGLFTARAGEIIADPALAMVVITDTIPPFRLDPQLVADKVVVLDAARLFGEAIKRIHSGGSITELLDA